MSILKHIVKAMRGSVLVLILVIPPLLGLLTGCGSPQKTTELAQQPAGAFTWSPTSDCGTCHKTEADLQAAPQTNDAAVGGFLAVAHMKAGSKCTSCHTDTTALASAHQEVAADSPMPRELTKTTVDEKTCLSSTCHNTTLADLVKKTAASTVLKDTEGKVVNPHAAPTLTKAHVDAEMTCSDCHITHKAQDANTYCMSCHHHGVFQCGTCHK